jgi:hypothetical protein
MESRLSAYQTGKSGGALRLRPVRKRARCGTAGVGNVPAPAPKTTSVSASADRVLRIYRRAGPRIMTNAGYADGVLLWIFLGGTVLDYFREARMATPGRRIYNCASAAIILVVMALVFAGLVPLWIFWTAFPVSLGLGALLTRKWIREDALKGYRAGQPE